MNKKFTGFITCICALFSFLFISVGFGDWIVRNDETILYEKKPDTNAHKVAYTRSGSTNTYYTTIESALSKTSSGTIYVIPGSNPTITKDCTVKAGVTLSLPYEDDLQNTHNVISEKGTNGSGFGDNVEGNLITRITLQKATLTIEKDATMIMGGVTGSTGVQSVVSGKYTELLMKSAKIDVKGSLQCYGFIKDEDDSERSSSIDVSGSIKTPIAVYDYSTATTLMNIKNNDVFPLKQFDVGQIRPEMTFEYGSSFVGRIHTYGKNAGHLTMDATLISTSGAFICMDETGSQVKWKFTDLTGTDSTSGKIDQHKTTISLFGKCSAGSLSIKINVLMNIDSKEFYLPIPCSYDIVLEKGGDFTVPNSIQGLKFMPGSSLTTKSGSRLTINTSTIFYQNCTSTSNTTFIYPSTSAALFQAGGTVVVNAGFDGVIKTVGQDAKLNFINGNNSIKDSKEGEASDTYRWGSYLEKQTKKVAVSSNDTGWNYSDLGKQSVNSKQYYSAKITGTNDSYGWYLNEDTEYGLRFELNSDTATNPNSISSFTQTSNFALKSLTNSDQALVFDGFYYSNDFAVSSRLEKYSNDEFVFNAEIALNYIGLKNNIVLYAKWINKAVANYCVNVTKLYTLDHLSELSIVTPSTFAVGDSFPLEKMDDYYLYQQMSADGTGVLVKKQFSGYLISISDEDGNSIKTYSLDSSGDSLDGVFEKFSLVDTTIMKAGYIATITPLQTINEQDFKFEIVTGTQTLDKQKSTSLEVKETKGANFNGITISYEWKVKDNNSKALIGDKSMASTTLTNGYSGSLRTTTITLICTIKDGSSVIVSPSHDITFQKGLLE